MNDSAIAALRRQQLVSLNDVGWAAVQRQPWDAEARECLAFWAEQQLPLVVTRQPPATPAHHVALGLPAPLRWKRRRLSLQVPTAGLSQVDEFPIASSIEPLLSGRVRADWRSLTEGLAAAGIELHVYGSYGWQCLTALDYLHAGSDLDLQLRVADAAAADLASEALAAAPFAAPRLDGELTFADGSAVAWREWQRWRAARVDRFLVKRLHGAALEHVCPA